MKYVQTTVLLDNLGLNLHHHNSAQFLLAHPVGLHEGYEAYAST